MKHSAGIRDIKVQKVTEYLQHALFKLASGERMPGIRTIMKETGTGRRTVAHALDLLVAEKVIRIDPQRGIFRTKPTEKNDEIRLLHWSLSFPDSDSFVGILFNTLAEKAAVDGRKLTVENVSGRSQEEVADELVKHGISNCIIYGSASSDFSEFLNAKMNFCMELLPHHTANKVLSLQESPEMTVIQLDYLKNLGYTRIGYIHFCGKNISLYPVQVMRLLDYYRFMAENHLYMNPAWVFQCTEKYENLEEGLKKIIATSPMPEVLIVPGSALKYLYSLCRKLGIRIGKDLAIFSCDDANENFVPDVTMITNNPKNIAAQCWQMFSALSRKEKVQSCHTELKIRIGQTVPSLKPPR